MLEQCKKDMENQQTILENLAVEVIKEQIEESINRTIGAGTDITFNLGKNGQLSNLKVKMNELTGVIVPNMIKNGLDKFIRNNLALIRDKRDYELSEELFSLYKTVIGESGKLLREYGYRSICGEYSNGKAGFLSMKHKGSMGPKPDNENLIEAQSLWIACCRKYIVLVDAQENEIKESKMKKARELWDNA